MRGRISNPALDAFEHERRVDIGRNFERFRESGIAYAFLSVRRLARVLPAFDAAKSGGVKKLVVEAKRRLLRWDGISLTADKTYQKPKPESQTPHLEQNRVIFIRSRIKEVFLRINRYAMNRGKICC